MLPINKNNSPCDPVSSNCVIWQGPDLPCVDICTGDSISAVIAGLCDQLVVLQECCASGGGSIDITNINQTTLEGGPATTIDQLIQLIIDNINNGGGSGGGIWSCMDTLSCTMEIPECYKQSTFSINNPDNILNILTALMHHHCNEHTMTAAMEANIRNIGGKVQELQRKPQGDPNPTLRSACVDLDNKNNQPIANLVNKIEVDYCVTKGNVGTEAAIHQALAKQPTNPVPLDTDVWQNRAFMPTIPNNPTSIAESLDAAWRLINDLRGAVAKLQTQTGNNGILLRMVGINTFYAMGTTCASALANGVTGGNYCVDLWNETGIQFDSAVRAYTQPVAESTYELTYGAYYALCPGNTWVCQYLGGVGGATSAPFWGEILPNCGG